MATPGEPYSAKDLEKLCRLKAGGETWATIADELGRSLESVKSRYKSSQAAPKPAVIATADSIDMEVAALRAEVARLRKGGDPISGRVNVTSPVDDDPEPDVGEEWAKAEAENAKRIKRAKAQRQLAVQFDTGKPIAIAFIADQHIAPGTPVDHKRMREDAELIQETPDLYAILGGDGVDNHLKHHAAILAARSQPDDQWKLFNWYLEIFAEKILAIAQGNHDAWANQIGGVDVLARIAKQMKVRYSTNEFHLTVNVSGAEYRIGVRHQYRLNSSFNQSHSVKQWLRLGHEDFDIGCIGHHHEGAMESFLYRGTHRIAIRPGSYQITSAYSGQYGWNDSVPLCPTVLLFPREKKMHGVFDVRDAAEILKFYQ